MSGFGFCPLKDTEGNHGGSCCLAKRGRIEDRLDHFFSVPFSVFRGLITALLELRIIV